MALSGLYYESEYTIQIVAADKLASVTKTVTIRRGIPVFDWGENDFAFHVPVYMGGNLLASKRSISATSYASISSGSTHKLKESIIAARPVFATLAYHAAIGRVSGGSGSREITFYNIQNAGSGVYINLARFMVSDDGMTLTLSDAKRITLSSSGVSVETGVAFAFGEVYLIS